MAIAIPVSLLYLRGSTQISCLTFVACLQCEIDMAQHVCTVYCVLIAYHVIFYQLAPLEAVHAGMSMGLATH